MRNKQANKYKDPYKVFFPNYKYLENWKCHQTPGNKGKKQARCVGRRDKRQRLASGECGWSTGEHSTTLGEEVWSGCTEIELTTNNATYGRQGGGR